MRFFLSNCSMFVYTGEMAWFDKEVMWCDLMRLKDDVWIYWCFGGVVLLFPLSRIWGFGSSSNGSEFTLGCWIRYDVDGYAWNNYLVGIWLKLIALVSGCLRRSVETSIISVQIGSATAGLIFYFSKRKVGSFICFVGCLRAINSTFSVNVVWYWVAGWLWIRFPQLGLSCMAYYVIQDQLVLTLGYLFRDFAALLVE